MDYLGHLASVFTSTQTTAVEGALQTAITNILDTFVALLPIMAIICGVGFGISFVYSMFRSTKHGN